MVVPFGGGGLDTGAKDYAPEKSREIAVSAL